MKSGQLDLAEYIPLQAAPENYGRGGSQEDQAVKAKLRISEESLSIGVEGLIVQSKVGPGQETEEGDDGIDFPAPISHDARCLGRESPCGHGGEGIAEGVEEGHLGQI